jgi:hypothetical protein
MPSHKIDKNLTFYLYLNGRKIIKIVVSLHRNLIIFLQYINKKIHELKN